MIKLYKLPGKHGYVNLNLVSHIKEAGQSLPNKIVVSGSGICEIISFNDSNEANSFVTNITYWMTNTPGQGMPQNNFS